MASPTSSPEVSLYKLIQSYTSKPKRGSLTVEELKTSLQAVSEEKRYSIVKSTFRGGKTIHQRVIIRGHTELLNCLLSNVTTDTGQSLLMMKDNEEKTSLHHASWSGTADSVKCILDYTSPENRQSLLMMKDYEGQTSLHHASRSGTADNMKCILDYTTPENRQELLMMKDNKGKTSLHHASRSETADNMKCILDYTTPENRQELLMMKDDEGKTSLHCAGRYDQVTQKLNYLLQDLTPGQQKQLIDIRDRNGQTALELAHSEGREEAIKILREYQNSTTEVTHGTQNVPQESSEITSQSTNSSLLDLDLSTDPSQHSPLVPNVSAVHQLEQNQQHMQVESGGWPPSNSKVLVFPKSQTSISNQQPENTTQASSTSASFVETQTNRTFHSLPWTDFTTTAPYTNQSLLPMLYPQNPPHNASTNWAVNSFVPTSASAFQTPFGQNPPMNFDPLHPSTERDPVTIKPHIIDTTELPSFGADSIPSTPGYISPSVSTNLETPTFPDHQSPRINISDVEGRTACTKQDAPIDFSNQQTSGAKPPKVTRCDTTNTKPAGRGYNQGKRTERPSLPTPRTTVVMTDQSQENEDVLDLSKVSTDKSFSPASQFPPISQSNQSNQVVTEPPVRPESTTSVFSEFSSVSGFSSFLKEQSWIEPGFFTLPPAMQHTGQIQPSISETTLQRSDHTPAMTLENEKTYFPSGQEYTAGASSNPDSNIETPTDQSNLLSSQTSLQVSRLTLSVRERNYWDGKALKTANSSSLNGNKGTTTHSTPSQQTKVSAGHQENEDNSQVSDLPINRRFCPSPAQSPLTFQLNVMNQQIDAHNVRPESTRSNLSDFSSVSGVSSLLEGIQLSPVASQHSTSEHSQPSTTLGSDHFQSYQSWIKSGFSTFTPAMQHLGQTQLPVSETTQQRSNAVLAMTSSKKMASFSFGQKRPEVTSSITDDIMDAPIEQSNQLSSDQTSLQVSRPFFSEIAASDSSMPDASVASDSLQSRTETSSASTPPFTIPLQPILHAASPAQQPQTTATNGSLDQSFHSIPPLYPSSPVLSPTQHLQTTSSSSDLLSTSNSSSILPSKTSKHTSVPSYTSVNKEAPILPLHHYPASTESYNAESTSTAAGTKRHAPVDQSMETESGPTPSQVSKYTSEVEGETLKLQHNGERYLFMFPSDGKVEDFTKDVNRITRADCFIKTSDGYKCIDNVALKALPLPFIVSIGNSETIITSRTRQENAPIASTSNNSGEAAAAENPASRFGRMSNADQVVQFLTFVHEHVRNGKTINAALKSSGKDRKTVDRFRNIYYLHVTNHGRLNELSEEWKRGGRQGALPGLDEQARSEVDWRLLEVLAGEGKATLFGGIKRGKS